MHPTDKYIYENVLPSKNKNFSTNLKFNATNDLFNVEKKKHLIHHAKKINKYVKLKSEVTIKEGLKRTILFIKKM